MTISDADFMAFKPMFDAIQLAIENADCSERVVTIAAGLRMVADAIDPTPMASAMQDVAEILARPKVRIPGHCMDDAGPHKCVSIFEWESMYHECGSSDCHAPEPTPTRESIGQAKLDAATGGGAGSGCIPLTTRWCCRPSGSARCLGRAMPAGRSGI